MLLKATDVLGWSKIDMSVWVRKHWWDCAQRVDLYGQPRCKHLRITTKLRATLKEFLVLYYSSEKSALLEAGTELTSRALRCCSCPTEYVISIAIRVAGSPLLRVETYINLGNGISPFCGEWLQRNSSPHISLSDSNVIHVEIGDLASASNPKRSRVASNHRKHEDEWKMGRAQKTQRDIKSEL